MTEVLPRYLTAPDEHSLGISFADFRQLAQTGLALTRDTPGELAVYRVEAGCVLDAFVGNLCLSILVLSRSQQLALFASDLDSVGDPVCLFESASNSKANWRQLKQIALGQP